MGLFNRNNRTGGMMDVIRCDEPSYLIWKWHPAGTQTNNNDRENSIRWGSSLRVKDGEVAVFVYKQKDGTEQDFIEGPFDETIKTKNLPVLTNLLGLLYEGDTPFQAEIYFINLARIIQTRFGVPFFDVADPRHPDFTVPIAVRGTISFGITDYRAFVKLHRLNNFSVDDFQKQIRDAVSRYVKDAVANAPATNDIPVVQIESRTAQINDAVEYDIAQRLKETFGVDASGVDIGAIEIDKTSDGYRQLMAVTKDVATAKVQAETTDYIERLRIQREEDQYARHMTTQTANIGAFKVEKQTEVGIAGAEALGHMGDNGAGSVDMGNGGTGFNPAAMMASMAVGGAVGQQMAGIMNGAMSGSNNDASSIIPPTVPVTKYHVAVGGQATGPYDIATLKQMASAGQLVSNTLVWKAGMDNWKEAGTVEELSSFIMPPIPPVE